MNEKMLSILNFCSIISGSIMSGEDILKEYLGIHKLKKKLLYDKAKIIMRANNGPIDSSLPILVIEFGIISAELNVDPGVVALAYLNKGKKKLD
ncbi:MAG: hypothetical protein RR595_13685 [Lysinibacillus sp.]